MIERCRLSPPRIDLRHVPSGPRGTLRTAAIIAAMMRRGAKDFCVRQAAIAVFRDYGVPPKDKVGEVWSLFDWVRKNIRYTRDIFRVELLHSARRMIQLRAGDCDDMTILLGAMLLSTGHPVRLALVGFRPDKPHVYSHIYPEVLLQGRWIPLDATIRGPMGSAPPALWKRVCEIGQETMRCSACRT